MRATSFATSAPDQTENSSHDESQQKMEEHPAQVVLPDEGPEVSQAAPSEVLEHLIGGQHLLLPGGAHENVVAYGITTEYRVTTQVAGK